MARTAKGATEVARAREALVQAQTAEQLRQALAVVLPLDYGLSLEQTALAIGHSVTWTCKLRNRFLAGEAMGSGHTRGGRRNQHMSEEQETQILAPFLDTARNGGILRVGKVKAELEASLGYPVALSTVYKLLRRHGWQSKSALNRARRPQIQGGEPPQSAPTPAPWVGGTLGG